MEKNDNVYKRKNDNKSMISVCIITPTYNEAENISVLLDMIYSDLNIVRYSRRKIDMHVLVVDDNSPDGTSDVVKIYKKNNSNVHILDRTKKEGLGAAYIAGMSYALSNLDPDILFEMDADLSHDPKYILSMIAKIVDGADMVIGSRYVSGGSLPKDWGLRRVLMSRVANLYTRIFLNMTSVKDCTGGFRAIKASSLALINLKDLKTTGYEFQISLLKSMMRKKFVIREIPIDFKERYSGESKVRLKDIFGVVSFVFMTSLEDIFLPNHFQKGHTNKTRYYNGYVSRDEYSEDFKV